VNYSSNANWLLTNLRITLDYPSGFEFIEASPKAIGKTEWDIPVLNSGAAGNISITGRLNGDIGEAKIFRARIGAWENGKYLELKDIQKASKYKLRPLNYPARLMAILIISLNPENGCTM